MLLIVAVAVLGTAGAGAQACSLPAAPATAAELAAVFRDTPAGLLMYDGDGTARGDSARRFATAGAWELEGGDVMRGVRLARAALRLGVPDPHAYRDFGTLWIQLRCPAESLAIYAEATRRWPDARWAWEGQARAFDALGRTGEAQAARARAAALPPERPPSGRDGQRGAV